MVLLLVALLTWLTVQGAGPPSEAYVFAQRDVARVSLAEAGLRADVLEARAGLLRDDDVLDQQVRMLLDAAAELRLQARTRASDAALLDRLVATARAEGSAVELFKTDDALLQNSFAYFDVLDTGSAALDGDVHVMEAVAWLGNGILHLIANPSTEAVAEVSRDLETLKAITAKMPSGPARANLQLMAAHGRILTGLIPGVDRDLARLFRIDTYDLRQAIRRSQDARRRAEETRAARFRAALYIVAVALSAVLVRFALQWRRGVSLLRQRAEVESLIAEISTRLLATPSTGQEAIMTDIVTALGTGFGADRCYVLLEGPFASDHRWSRVDGDWPPGWPARMLPHLDQAGRDLLEISVASRRGEPLVETLRGAGVQAWCGVVLRCGSDRVGILGFDWLGSRLPWPRGGSGLVRMAGHVVQSAFDRRYAGAERRALEERLSRARRLEAIGAFASGIAHNVNNVVSAVFGHAEMAVERMADDPVGRHHVREIEQAAERARQLVIAILEFGSGRMAARTPVPIRPLMEQTFSMLAVSIPESLTAEFPSAIPDRVVIGNAAQLQQVMMNLVRNSYQATAAGGRISVEVELDAVRAGRRLSHGRLEAGDYVRVAVSDTGSGMTERTLDRIFEPFFTGRPAGTGLGLATVREIVHDHGGSIDVRSVFGRGTTFDVWLPVADADSAADVFPGGNGEAVLVFSPDGGDLRGIEDMIAALGYEPIGFQSREAMLDAARVGVERFAACLLDTRCIADPLDLLRALRRSGFAHPATLIASAAAEIDPETIGRLNVEAVLSQPPRSTALADALARCCRPRSARPLMLDADGRGVFP